MQMPEHLLWHTSGSREGVKLETYLQALKKHLNQVHLHVAVKLGKSKWKARAYFDKVQIENAWESGDLAMLLS